MARVPDTVGHQPKWQLALALVDEVTSWGLAPPVILADAGYGDTDEFRLGLEQRGLTYVVQLAPTATAHPEDVTPEIPPYRGTGRHRWLATAPSPARWRPWPSRPARWAGSVWPGARAPTGTCCARSSLRCASARPAACGAARCLVAMACCRCAGCWSSGLMPSQPRSSTGWRTCPPIPSCTIWSPWPSCAGGVEHDYRECKDALGLDHFEGRSWPGWHHHVTLVSVAHAL
jgi:hypothetical protein